LPTVGRDGCRADRASTNSVCRHSRSAVSVLCQVAVSQDAPAWAAHSAGDRPHALSCLPNVPDAWKQLAQLHGRREFAALLVGGADHGSLRVGDDEHLQTMGYADRRVQVFVVEVLRPSPRRPDGKRAETNPHQIGSADQLQGDEQPHTCEHDCRDAEAAGDDHPASPMRRSSGAVAGVIAWRPGGQ